MSIGTKTRNTVPPNHLRELSRTDSHHRGIETELEIGRRMGRDAGHGTKGIVARAKSGERKMCATSSSTASSVALGRADTRIKGFVWQWLLLPGRSLAWPCPTPKKLVTFSDQIKTVDEANIAKKKPWT